MSFHSGMLVVAGPSGVGKSTLIQGALKLNPRWRFSVSATTRPIRPGEVDGREYHFVSLAEFTTLISAGAMLEYAEVYGNFYGTPRQEIERAAAAGQHLLIEVDTVGCLSIRALQPDAPLLGVLPPGLAELRRRLADRGTESAESLARRYANAIAELQRMRGFNYVIINRDVEQATASLLDVMRIIEAGLHQPALYVDRLLAGSGGPHEA
jgi:guanylate kinase